MGIVIEEGGGFLAFGGVGLFFLAAGAFVSFFIRRLLGRLVSFCSISLHLSYKSISERLQLLFDSTR